MGIKKNPPTDLPNKKSTNKPLTAKQFYSKYAQHIDLRGREGKAEENRKSIMEKGFKSGYPNAFPPYKGGEPTDLMSKQYGKPRKGDTVYLAPKHAWKDTPNGMKIQEGWKPEQHEVITVDDPNQSMHDAYLSKVNKKANGGKISLKDCKVNTAETRNSKNKSW